MFQSLLDRNINVTVTGILSLFVILGFFSMQCTCSSGFLCKKCAEDGRDGWSSYLQFFLKGGKSIPCKRFVDLHPGYFITHILMKNDFLILVSQDVRCSKENVIPGLQTVKCLSQITVQALYTISNLYHLY